MAVMVAVPLLIPEQAASVVTTWSISTVHGTLLMIVNWHVVTQPVASVTETVYTPPDSPMMTNVPSAFNVIDPDTGPDHVTL
jgi:hypothetical protein